MVNYSKKGLNIPQSLKSRYKAWRLDESFSMKEVLLLHKKLFLFFIFYDLIRYPAAFYRRYVELYIQFKVS